MLHTDFEHILVRILIIGTIHTLFFFRTHTMSSARTCIWSHVSVSSGQTMAHRAAIRTEKGSWALPTKKKEVAVSSSSPIAHFFSHQSEATNPRVK